MSDFIKRCDDYDDVEYVVLTKHAAFTAHWKDSHTEKIGPSNIALPLEGYRAIVGQALAFYENYDEREAFEKQCKAEDPDCDLSKLRYALLRKMIRGLDIPINSVHEAEQLFLNNNCDRAALQKNCSPRTL